MLSPVLLDWCKVPEGITHPIVNGYPRGPYTSPAEQVVVLNGWMMPSGTVHQSSSTGDSIKWADDILMDHTPVQQNR
jgi:hypothetical protein